MYGSYGSYSSLTPAMDIPSRSGSYHSTSHFDASCAFPSWPRRESLSSSPSSPAAAREQMSRTSSYLSDEDLEFLSEPSVPAVAYSLAAAEETASPDHDYYGSRTPSPLLAPAVRHLSHEAVEAMRLEQALRQREYVAVALREKEQRRRQQQAAARAAACGSSRTRKSSGASSGAPTATGPAKVRGASPRSKLSAAAMTPIAEAAE